MAGEKTKQLVYMGILTAVMFIGQVAMGFLPNVEIVSLMVILSAIIFGKKAFLMIAVFVLLEGCFYGFGLWWINYTYIWAILAAITLCFRRQESPLFWSILSGFYGLSFGALCSIPYFFISGPSGAFAYWVSGVIYDIPHCIGNFVLCLILYVPLRKVMEMAVHGRNWSYKQEKSPL